MVGTSNLHSKLIAAALMSHAIGGLAWGNGESFCGGGFGGGKRSCKTPHSKKVKAGRKENKVARKSRKRNK